MALGARTSAGTVLHVDDDPLMRLAVARTLGSAGFSVVSQPDGPSALAAAHERVPDLIVLDVDLPGLSGFEVCVRLRASSRTRRVPVLHVSGARTTVDDRVQGLGGGADAYLVQPVPPEELVAVARALIRRARPRRTGDGPGGSKAALATAARDEALRSALQVVRNPLAAMAIHASGLAASSKDAVVRARAQSISEARDVALRALSDLSELAALESGRDTLAFESCAPMDLVEASVRSAVVPAGVSLMISSEAPACPDVRCDRRRTAFVLSTLLGRALRTSSAGAIVRIGAEAEGLEIRFGIEGGLRLTDRERAQLSEVLWHRRTRHGAVPPLMLVRAAVEAHSGRLWFDTDLPIAQFTIPRWPADVPRRGR